MPIHDFKNIEIKDEIKKTKINPVKKSQEQIEPILTEIKKKPKKLKISDPQIQGNFEIDEIEL